MGTAPLSLSVHSRPTPSTRGQFGDTQRRKSAIFSVCRFFRLSRKLLNLKGIYGLPGGTRTPDLLLRRQLLYPVELRAVRGCGADGKKAHGVGLCSVRMVGAAGFELATLCSQSRCATRLRYAPTSRGFYPQAGTPRLGQAADEAPRVFTQRFAYCVLPNRMSRDLSSVSGLRASASTATPRCTAGRSAMRSNQAFRRG